MHGILLLDKPLSISSNAALQRVKRLFGVKKAGHTGSLDPLATGMLPICFGEATKFSQYLLDSNKYYQVTAQLGAKTNTGDAEGQIIETYPVANITAEKLQNCFKQFLGNIKQIPPMYSALKMNGQPLYKLARKGIEVERKERSINIFNLTLIDIKNDQFTMNVHCSKGTYIRTLVEDMGDVLGCGAYVAALHRTAVAPYENKKMVTLDFLQDCVAREDLNQLSQLLLPIDSALHTLPCIKLDTSSAYYFRLGQSIRVTENLASDLVRVLDDNEQFMGLGSLSPGSLSPKRLVAHSNVSVA